MDNKQNTFVISTNEKYFLNSCGLMLAATFRFFLRRNDKIYKIKKACSFYRLCGVIIFLS